MKLTYYGHAACLVEAGEHKILFDPFLQGNPLATVFPHEVQCDYIILTHGHEDHFGDTVAIAERTDATVIAMVELAAYCESKGLKTHPLNLGGEHSFPFGTVKLTQAFHSSSIIENGRPIYLGPPAGVLLKSDRTTLYHAGDTALFGDMKLIGEMNRINCALLPIGDNFTMGVNDAAEAAGFLRPSIAVPIHYNTFPLIEVDPQALAMKVEEMGIQARILNSGEGLEI